MTEVIVGMLVGVLIFCIGLYIGLRISKHEVVTPTKNIEPQDDKKEYIEELKKEIKISILEQSIQDDEEEAKMEKIKELRE